MKFYVIKKPCDLRYKANVRNAQVDASKVNHPIPIKEQSDIRMMLFGAKGGYSDLSRTFKTGKKAKVYEIFKAFNCSDVRVEVDAPVVIDSVKSCNVRNKSPTSPLQCFFCVWVKIKWEI